MTVSRSFLRDQTGASSAEFVLVLPVVALMIFGLFDAGMFAWRINTLEKATQAGARFAAVTNPVAENLPAADFVGKSVTVNGSTVVLQQGDTIPVEAMDPIECVSGSCTCVPRNSTKGPCPTPGYNPAAFTAIRTRMQAMDPSVGDANLVVEYRGSGLGYAGDPDGMEVSPTVTVRLQSVSFTPLTGFIFRSTGIALPDFAYSLTMEDGSGTRSN